MSLNVSSRTEPNKIYNESGTQTYKLGKISATDRHVGASRHIPAPHFSSVREKGEKRRIGRAGKRTPLPGVL
jgi:hypothetical protein